MKKSNADTLAIVLARDVLKNANIIPTEKNAEQVALFIKKLSKELESLDEVQLSTIFSAHKNQSDK